MVGAFVGFWVPLILLLSVAIHQPQGLVELVVFAARCHGNNKTEIRNFLWEAHTDPLQLALSSFLFCKCSFMLFLLKDAEKGFL